MPDELWTEVRDIVQLGAGDIKTLQKPGVPKLHDTDYIIPGSVMCCFNTVQRNQPQLSKEPGTYYCE